MRKIKTIFERNWEGNKKIMDKYIPELFPMPPFQGVNWVATEKIDGTNVRITVRNHFPVRMEKRRNPTKLEKQKGIEEPWYVDASEYEAQDKWVVDGVKNTDFSGIEDGSWEGELVGPNIQGNPLNLETNRVVFFSHHQAPIFNDVPFTFEGLKNWLPLQKSKYGKDCGIEGIVWHNMQTGEMFKIKTKDF